MQIEFTLNGTTRRLATESRRSLLEVLREDFQLTGAKYGCGEGQCRACTVLVDGTPVTSCLVPIAAMQQRKVETIEGLASGDELHPVQQAFLDENAIQCGYCVPGMVLTAVSLLRQGRALSRAEIMQGLNGNLCRCCGYINIIQAVERAAKSSAVITPKSSAP